MSEYFIQWRVVRLLEQPPPGIITRMRGLINISTVGVIGAALICGGLAWKHLMKDGEKKEANNDILKKLLEGEQTMDIQLFDIRRSTNKKVNYTPESVFKEYSNCQPLVDGFVHNEEQEEEGRAKYENMIRDEPDGASDSDEIITSNKGEMVSCSTFNSIVDDSMVDIVKTAKEARAMIRKLSFTSLQDGDGRVKFELGWDEESEDCVASFIRTNGADVWDRERETPVLSFKQSDCDFQYFDFDWDNSLGWVNDNRC